MTPDILHEAACDAAIAHREELSVLDIIRAMEAFGLSDPEIAEQLALLGVLQ